MYKLLAPLYFMVIIFGSYAVPLESFTGMPGTEETPDLIAQTLAEDISTAGYYELLSWSHDLSLKETGSRKELQQRLMKYYNVKPPTAVKGGKRRIEIESAKETEYFTIESIKENYVVLRGDVVLIIQDKEKNIKHTIKADKIIFNQTENTVTAKGNVEYRLHSASREEVFKGESISFNLNNWEGIFYRGKTERKQEQGGKKITYFFKGKEIIRKKNDVVILNNGSITSCTLDNNSHYHIKAKKIWVLAPGEWAIQNALLYIGRVPVMAVPFFFYPGDKLFFHPAIGYRDREGNYIQTTTYFIGRKKQDSSSISFLNLNHGDNGEYKENIKGLFLYKTKEILNKPNEDFLKVYIDLYSRIGAFAGIEGSFHPDVKFKSGIAVSRDLFYNTLTDLYTPFYMDENDKLVSIWNSSYLLGIPVPFRYGVSSNIKSKTGIFSFSGNIELYSDPYFSEDFYNRSEGLDWNAILSGQSTEPASGIIKNNLLWFLNMKVNMADLIKSSVLSSLSFPYINIKYSIQSKDKTIADTDTISSVDPSRLFYYPLSLKIPEVSFNAGGTIYNSGGTGTGIKNRAINKRERLKDPGQGYRFDIIKKNEKVKPAEKEKKGSVYFIPPVRIKDTAVSQNENSSNIKVSYQFKPRFIIDDTFDYQQWEKSEDVDYSLLYTTFSGSGFSRIDSGINLLNSLVNVNESIVFEGNYVNRFNKSNSLAEEEWKNILLNDYSQRRFDIKNIISLSLQPLIQVESFKGTVFSYNLNWLCYKLIFSDFKDGVPVYTGINPAWDKSSVLANNFKLLLKFMPVKDINQSLSVTYSMPPLDESLTTRFDSIFWLSNTSVQVSLNKNKDTGWILKPVSLGENLIFGSEASLSATANLDGETFVFNNFTTGAKLWNINTSLSFERMIPVDPLGNQTGTKEVFLPLVFKINYKIPGNNYYFWKNRINIETSVDTDYSTNLQKYIDSSFNFTLKFNVSIYKFLDLSFSASSYNKRMYLYIPEMAKKLDEKWVNPVYDLLRSFNFFNIKDRYRTFFKIKSLSVKGVHHLHDWDLTFEYSGQPKLHQNTDGTAQYEWATSFSIFIQWPSFPLMKSKITGDSQGINIRG